MRPRLGIQSVVKPANSEHPRGSSTVAAELGRAGQRILCLPFDMARERYAKSVQIGFLEESMLSGARFEGPRFTGTSDPWSVGTPGLTAGCFDNDNRNQHHCVECTGQHCDLY